MPTESMDNLSSLCGRALDFVQSIHGHCPDFPLIPWTMSRESMDSVYILQTGTTELLRLIQMYLSDLSGLKLLATSHLLHSTLILQNEKYGHLFCRQLY